MKVRKVVIAGMALSMLMSSTAMAATWRTGAGENQSRWWYDNDDGSYANSGWQWIDGNGDGIAECYYFDSEGWLLVNTTTPDGHQVNADGAWTENGVVQTQNAAVTNASNNEVSLDGQYNYYMSAFYVKNEQTNSYELYKETKRFDNMVTWVSAYDEIWNERFSIGQAADLMDLDIYVQTVGENKIMHYGNSDMEDTRWYSELRDGEWICTECKSGDVIYEVDSSNSDPVLCDGVTYEFIHTYTVGQNFEEGNFQYPFIGKEVMVKEIYKKK